MADKNRISDTFRALRMRVWVNAVDLSDRRLQGAVELKEPIGGAASRTRGTPYS